MKRGSTIGATFLIVGSCIGVGMLGLPVVSAVAGFIPTTLAMIVCYFFAVTTGLLLAEASLWFDERVHLVSLAEFALGKFGKMITWTFFLFLFYCLFVAYIEGGGEILSNALSVPRGVGMFFTALIVGALVYTGANSVSYISRLFFLGLVISFGALITTGLPHIEGKRLLYQHFGAVFGTIPILFICFGYQNLVPTVVHYVRNQPKVVRNAIFFGNLIPFVIYTVWNLVVLGLIADPSPKALAQVVHHGGMVTSLLEHVSGSESILFFVNIFSFFAIFTPFMACALSFVDFLRDGLKRVPFFQNTLSIYSAVLLPPLIFSLVYPHLFLSALGFAGGFIDAVLFGILPVLIVWVGRKRRRENSYRVFGGTPLLAVVFFFALSVILYRLVEMIGK